jgi:asparagine synthase (glutamine-hydrolysing)
MYQTARDTGVRVVLSGEWGDVIVSYGTGALREFVVTGKLFRALREITGLSKNFNVKKRKIIWSNILVPFLPRKFRHRDDYNPTTWIRDDFAQRTGLTEYYSYLRKAELKPKTSREHHFFDLISIPISLGLETTDKNAGAHSIELRYPFLDRRIVEFCLALPPEQRIRNGFTRAIEREAMAPFLPPEIRRRTSKVLTNPYIRYSLVTFEGIRLKNYLFGHPDVLGSYINLDLIHESYRTLMAGRGGDLVSLWYSLVLSFWLHEGNRIEFNTRNT